MKKNIIDFMNFAENDEHFNFTRFELVEIDNGKVFYLDIESDQYLDIDDGDSFNERYKIGIELDKVGLNNIIEEGLRLGYFIENDFYSRKNKEILYNRDKFESMIKWLKVEKYVFG